jgi:hypothetical protein
MRRMLSKAGAGLVVAAIASAPAYAGETHSPARSMFSAASLEGAVRQVSRQGKARSAQTPEAPSASKEKDSIFNGMLIGAAVGGVGGSALIVVASGGSDDFRKAMWNVSALPTLGGAAIGALIDALR